MTDFYYIYNSNATTVSFNTYWTYYLCEIEFEEYYIGMIEQYVPIFEKKDNVPNLEYEIILIPTYIVKLKSIKPLISENKQ